MTISVEIADRLYDYTDEEKAEDAVAEFQAETGLDDAAIISIWADNADSRRNQLEAAIFSAIDSNGSNMRAKEHVPGGIELVIAENIGR